MIQSIRAQCNIVNTTCANANLRRATRAVTQMYDQFLSSTGLQATQFTLMVACGVAGSAPITALAEALVMDRTTLARNLRPLEIQGLVKIIVGNDRRVRMVTLSEKGYALLDKALPLWKEAQEQIVQGFGQQRLTGFLQDLSAMVELARAS